jgi:hypothetical protein
MTDDRFWPRNFAALYPVILSADHARTGLRRSPRRNLGRGKPSLSPDPSARTDHLP